MKLEYEYSKLQDILSILVPKFVKDLMTQGGKTFSQEFDKVTILFCDIVDFDKIIKSERQKVVQLLDNLFRQFDCLCITHGIQKIETVGKTYMACAGLKICEQNIPQNLLKLEQTRRIIDMAFDMVNYASNFTYGQQEKIKIKIGIHIGKVIAGVIGYHKPQFSLIGDTVNTTSRVCSTGDDGCINISEEAYNALGIRTTDIYFEKKIVEMKGKGQQVTYKIFQKDLVESINRLDIKKKKTKPLIDNNKIDFYTQISPNYTIHQSNQGSLVQSYQESLYHESEQAVASPKSKFNRLESESSQMNCKQHRTKNKKTTFFYNSQTKQDLYLQDQNQNLYEIENQIEEDDDIEQDIDDIDEMENDQRFS